MAKVLRSPALEDLKDAPYNPRGIEDDGLRGLTFSIKSFGDISGITWNQRTGNIVTGHQRFRSLIEEHFEQITIVDGVITWPGGETFPVRTVDWPLAKEQAANIAANSHLLGGYFTEEVGPLLDQIKDTSPALHGGLLFEELSADLGFTETEDDEPDEAPPDMPANPITKLGDIWQLGDHLLMCADATLKKNWRILMGSTGRGQLIFTDPRCSKHEAIASDELRDDKLVALVRRALKWAADYAEDSAAFYIWHTPATRGDFEIAIAAAGLQERQYIIWVKEAFTLGRADYQHGFEPCFYAAKSGHAPRFDGDRRQSTIWRMAMVEAADGSVLFELADGLKISTGDGGTLVLKPTAPKGKRIRKVRLGDGDELLVQITEEDAANVWRIKRDPHDRYAHPTQKPIGLAAVAIRNSSAKGELVLDPFAGSGSTLIAADAHDRVARCMELAPGYCDVIVERWQDRTGEKATRA